MVVFDQEDKRLVFRDGSLHEHLELLPEVAHTISSGERWTDNWHSQHGGGKEHIFPDPEQVRGETYGRTFFEAFCERVKRNLRVVISMNHKQESFLQNCAANPALFTKCTIIWSGAWADASMEMILKEELQDDISSLAAKERDNLIRCTIQIHELCQKRSARVQPLYFFSVARTYLQIYRLKLSARGSQATHLRKGLQKLREAKQLVGQLTLEAEEKQRLLAQQ